MRNISICASAKFIDDIEPLRQQLEAAGFTVYGPKKIPGVDYWSTTGRVYQTPTQRAELIRRHFNNIQLSQAILVANFDRPEGAGYIGANTFAEIMLAHVHGLKIFMLQDIPAQPYIREELLDMHPTILKNGNNLQEILNDPLFADN